MEFKIQGTSIELCKLLKACGLCESGGHAKQVIQEGSVSVDGAVETRRNFQVRSGQKVSFAGSEITVLS